MAQDFRTLLKESTRHERYGRTYEELGVGDFLLSVQASVVHASIPAETLDDPNGYQAFELIIRQRSRNIDQPGYGAWFDLEQQPWSSYLKPGDIGGMVEADEVPTETVQAIYDYLLDYTPRQRNAKVAERKRGRGR